MTSKTCTNCSQSFLKLAEWRLHKRNCTSLTSVKSENENDTDKLLKIRGPKSKRNFVCHHCQKKFKYKLNLKKHILSTHLKKESDQVYQCQYCLVNFSDSRSLKKHIAKEHKNEQNTCPHCKKQFTRTFDVLRHMKQKNCGGYNDETYPCSICNVVFKRKDNLLAHLRGHISTKKIYQCRHCTFRTSNFHRLVSHDKSQHDTIPSHYECDYCGKKFISRLTMIKHLDCHGDKKFVCSECGYRTHTLEVMRRHVLRHAPEKPFKCDRCDHSFIQLQQLKRHQEAHRQRTCNECGIYFKSKVGFLKHKQEKHNSEGELTCPYNGCPLANKTFIHELTLKEHMRTHEDRTFECEVCFKSFTLELHLRRHLDTHRLEQPRRCMYCVSARAYVRGDMLVRHVRAKHADIFRDHLMHVRANAGDVTNEDRVKKSEVEAILNLLDAVANKIMADNFGDKVLYGGMQVEPETTPDNKTVEESEEIQSEELSEHDLAINIMKLMEEFIDEETLKAFGWITQDVDVVLSRVVSQFVAAADTWLPRAARLRENARRLFLHVLEDTATAKMLETHSIDQVVLHILKVNSNTEKGEKSIKRAKCVK